uniref:Uncharacterized protein n=1 Tax=Anguilla anguilla TaxID=7936 RepID=A0A0E9X3L9_ANGAN
MCIIHRKTKMSTPISDQRHIKRKFQHNHSRNSYSSLIHMALSFTIYTHIRKDVLSTRLHLY